MMFGKQIDFICEQCNEEKWIFGLFEFCKKRCLQCRKVDESFIHQQEDKFASGMLSRSQGIYMFDNFLKADSIDSEQYQLLIGLLPEQKKIDKIDKLLIPLLKKNQGFEPKVYIDTKGYPTIGYGHKILEGEKFQSITKPEAEILMKKDLLNAKKEIQSYFGDQVIETISQVRLLVLVDMAYNMGNVRWPKLTEAIKKMDYEKAAEEILNSEYAKQVGSRAKRNAIMMKTGEMCYISMK